MPLEEEERSRAGEEARAEVGKAGYCMKLQEASLSIGPSAVHSLGS